MHEGQSTKEARPRAEDPETQGCRSGALRALSGIRPRARRGRRSGGVRPEVSEDRAAQNGPLTVLLAGAIFRLFKCFALFLSRSIKRRIGIFRDELVARFRQIVGKFSDVLFPEIKTNWRDRLKSD